MSAGDYVVIRSAFQKKAITDYGTSVTRTPVTKTTSNTYGDETLSDGTPGSITVFFQPKLNKSWDFSKDGEIKGLDALMLTLYGQALTKNDKITYQSKNYRIHDIDDVYLEGNKIYRRANLYITD